MSLKERSYSVLVVSGAEKMNTALTSFLSESHLYTLKLVSSVSAARRALSERSFDHVLINSPLPDDPGIRFAIEASASKETVVLLLVRTELFDDVYDKVVDFGVYTLYKPLSRPVLSLAFGWMASTRERLRGLEQKSLSLEEKMEEIRLVNRAKWLLISELKMAEPQAHRYIEKQAMDRCIPRREVAEEIIRTYL